MEITLVLSAFNAEDLYPMEIRHDETADAGTSSLTVNGTRKDVLLFRLSRLAFLISEAIFRFRREETSYSGQLQSS